MIEIYPRLYIAGLEACVRTERPDWAVVHACKSPCHQNALGYRGSLPSSHPNYLVFRSGSHLYLNIIDPPGPLFKPQLFSESVAFIAEQIRSRNVLVHCNLGHSRSPSICLLYLALTGVLPDTSYEEAASRFSNLYGRYAPGAGIRQYFRTNWEALLGDCRAA